MPDLPNAAIMLMVFCLLVALAIRLNKKSDFPEPKPDRSLMLQVAGLMLLTITPLTIWNNLPWTVLIYFAGGIILQVGLIHTPLQGLVRGIILLLAGIGVFHFYNPADFDPTNYLALILGLLCFKLTEVWQYPELNSPFADILPICLWASSLYLQAYVPNANLLSFVGCCLSLALLIQAASSFFASETLYIIIAKLSIATAGAFLIASLLSLKVVWAIPALLFTGSIVMFEVFKHFDQKATENSIAQSAFFKLAAVVLVSFLTSRFIGAWGWLIGASGALATGTLASNGKFMLFLLMRTLLQGYILNHNPNVTGVNLLHVYTSSALFIGLVLVTFAPFYINFLKDHKSGLLIFITKCILIALFSNYFLHAEATGALLISLNCMTAINIVLSHAREEGRPNMSLVVSMATGIIIVLCTISASQLLNLGETSHKLLKLTMLGVLGGLVFGSVWISNRKTPTNISGKSHD